MYMPDTIDLEPDNKETIGAFFGSLAGKFAYKPELRKRLDELMQSARRSTNRHYVLDAQGNTIAAQSTRLGAMNYMGEGRVLVSIHLMGCGRATHVEGTNGGTMPCGAMLTQFGKTEPYYCAACVPGRV
jgi:hypothetical protein